MKSVVLVDCLSEYVCTCITLHHTPLAYYYVVTIIMHAPMGQSRKFWSSENFGPRTGKIGPGGPHCIEKKWSAGENIGPAIYYEGAAQT